MWISTDPENQYWSAYAYCGGNPTNLTDPDGAVVPYVATASYAFGDALVFGEAAATAAATASIYGAAATFAINAGFFVYNTFIQPQLFSQPVIPWYLQSQENYQWYQQTLQSNLPMQMSGTQAAQGANVSVQMGSQSTTPTGPGIDPEDETGQEHHAISKKVHRELDRHPNLKGKYQSRDPRFTTRAKDLTSHRGYQQWHRQLDNEVVKWIRNNPRATPQQFEDFLRLRYNQSDLITRFPKGLPTGQ